MWCPRKVILEDVLDDEDVKEVSSTKPTHSEDLFVVDKGCVEEVECDDEVDGGEIYSVAMEVPPLAASPREQLPIRERIPMIIEVRAS